MNVLIIGSGGREHAIAWSILQSLKLKKLFVAPGNAGTKQIAENILIDVSRKNEVVDFCKKEKIDLVVIGPEKPLVEGLADFLCANGFNVFGPSAEAAKIEGEKAFAKELMKEYGIPTAQYSIFNKEDKNKLLEYLKGANYPVVIKVSGLAAGKGVIIPSKFDDAVKTVNEIFEENKFGEAGNIIVVEEFLEGEEASVFAVTDGENYILLPPAQDHKRIFDGDKGPNTGGMGAYAPAPVVDSSMLKRIENEIIKPAIKALKEKTGGFVGCLYAGLMITKEGPKVVEFNCRFGDPETQAVLPLLEGDFLELLFSASIGKLNKESVRKTNKTAVCVVAASDGYPGAYEKGFEIKGLEKAEKLGALVFHAGTKEENGKIFTNGGRVLGVTTVIEGSDLMLCKQNSYGILSEIEFKGMYYRKDIADKGIRRKK
jgi:phosphoribosylamine--glycine ligase